MKKSVKFLLLLGLVFGAVLFYLTGLAQEEKAPINIVGIKLEKIDSSKAEVIIEASNPVEYKDSKITKPPMIVVDIPNAIHKVTPRALAVDKGLIKQVRSSQFKVKPQPSVRVVVDLKEITNYEIATDANRIIVKIDQPQMAEAEPAPAAEAAPAKEEVPAPAPLETVVTPPATPVVAETVASPPAEEPKKAKSEAKEKETSDQLISLDFKDADIRDILRILSVKSGINMVYGDDVKGTLTIHLDKVTFQDGLNIILRITGLTYDYIAPNVIRVSTPGKVVEEQKTMVTQTGVFGCNYAKASEIVSPLTGLLSPQGKIQTDTRTNSLIITDVPDSLKKVVEMIKILDVPTPQVMIEAQIVQINRDEVQDLGVSWTLTKTWTKTGETQTATMNTGAAVGTVPGLVTLGKLTSQTNLNAILGALETKGKGKVLSNPRIATLNNQAASILSGSKVPYTTTTTATSGAQTTSTNFLDVGIKLDVTPNVNLDKKVTLKVHAEVSSVETWIGDMPQIGTRQADTNILVADGETIVIGGLLDETTQEGLSKVPFISEIPILGYLFQHKRDTLTKRELLVFITTHIL